MSRTTSHLAASDTYFFRAYGGHVVKLGHSEADAVAWAKANGLMWQSGEIHLQMSGDTELDWIGIDRDIRDAIEAEADEAVTLSEVA